MPGTSVGVGGSRRFTIRRTVCRCHTASSSTDNQVLSTIPTMVMKNDAMTAAHTDSMVRPSRISLASHRISPFATRPSRPAVHRMTREKNLEMIGHSTALRTERSAAATSDVPKSRREMLGMIHAINQKLTDVIANSTRWRRSGTRPGVRDGSVRVVTPAGYETRRG